MGETKVWLTIPFTFAFEGRYEVSTDKKIAGIDISYVQNDEAVNQIMGIVAQGQRRLMPDDPEGMANISNIIIKFPFEYSDAYLGTEGPEKLTRIKHLCIKYLNRLRDVIRYYTNRYWLRSLSPYHVNIYRLETYNDLGKGKQIYLFEPPSANFLPLAVKEYSEVESLISEMLMNETPITLSDKIYLDALNFFHFFSFAEAIISANVALEVFVWRHLFERFRSQGKNQDEAKREVERIFEGKFHKVMKNHYFNNMNDESRKRDPIWNKLENVRNTRRSVVHPHTTIPSLEETKQLLLDIHDISIWVSKQR